jgi:hypothetical protein
VPANATVFTIGLNGALQTYTSLAVMDLWADSAALVVEQAREVSSPHLFVNVSNLESQWRGREPEQALLALRDMLGLRELGTVRGWTLYRIGTRP